MTRPFVALLSLLGLALGCPGQGPGMDAGPAPTDVRTLLGVPEILPLPVIPEDNPLTEAKIALGRRVFYDKRLSRNQTQSCGSCHEQARAFTDGLALAEGSTGQFHFRSSMSLTNVAFAGTLTWASPVVRVLEDQALLPLFGEDPVELGFSGAEDELVQRFRDDDEYPDLFADAFPDRDQITLKSIVDAIATFERALISFDSAYDRAIYGGDQTAMSESARRGLALFQGERLECFHCHGGYLFTDTTTHENTVFDEVFFHNNGLYNLDEDGAYPAADTGLFKVTGHPEDMGRFKAPSLRNIAVTAPYMHDGSLATLDDVLDHYARGGTLTEDGPNAGDGKDNPIKSGFVSGFVLTDQERADLHAFFDALTDETFLTRADLSDPWP